MIDLRELGPTSISLEMLRRYLVAMGWHTPARSTDHASSLLPKPGTRRNFEIYTSDISGFEGIELVIPSSVDSSEYAIQIARTIDALSALEDRPEEDVAQSIREVAFDVVRSRIPDAQVLNDSIHLEIARSFVVGIRGVLASAATAELNPSSYFLRLRKEATDYADHCRFGHTFRGSFGFTVESPLQPNKQVPLPGFSPLPPFERRVILRLVNGLRNVGRAVATDTTDPITNSIQTGLNANVCEQLATLVEETSQGGVAFDFSFSPEWQGSHAYPAEPGQFFLDNRHVEVIKAAAKELRAKVQSSPEVVFGRVIRLASDANPADLTDLMGEREVAILWSSENLGDITVRASLSPPDYLRAVEAHGAGRPIEVSGTLEKRSRRWVLLNPTNFTLET